MKSVALKVCMALFLALLPKYALAAQDLPPCITLEAELTGHKKGTTYLGFFHGESQLGVGSKNDSITLWDTRTWKVLIDVPGPNAWVNGALAQFSPNGKYILTLTPDKIGRSLHILQTPGATLLHVLRYNSTIYAASFSSDSKKVAVGYADDTAKIWDISTGKILRTLRGPMKDVTGVAFSPDGKYIATTALDAKYLPDLYYNTVKIWDLHTGKEIFTIADTSPNPQGLPMSVKVAAFSPDGKNIIVLYPNGSAKVWNIAEQSIQHSLTMPKQAISTATYSPDGRYLATGTSDAFIRIWDASTMQELCTFKAHDYSMANILFSADNTTLVTGDAVDPVVKLWKLRLEKK